MITPEYKIPEYDIPYYEDNTRISNSAIGWFLNKGPAYFRNMMDGKEKGLDLPQLRKGTMIHEFLLQPDKFWDDYVLFDGGKPKSAQAQKFCENLINTVEIEPNKQLSEAYRKSYSIVGKSEDKILSEALKISVEYKDYIKAIKSKKILISQYDLDQLMKIQHNVGEHKLARQLIRRAGDHGNIHVYHEFQINWYYWIIDESNHNNIACKSLLDSCTFNFETKTCTIMDIKTTAKLWHFEDSMKEFDYCRQLCFYQEAVYWYLNNELELSSDEINEWRFEFYIIAIDTTGSNEIRVFRLTTSQVTSRGVTIYDFMRVYLWHLETDNWDHSYDYYTGDGSETLNL
nr:MAG TPA: Exodeoxyribonuclease 8 [Crassvirales sp.]